MVCTQQKRKGKFNSYVCNWLSANLSFNRTVGYCFSQLYDSLATLWSCWQRRDLYSLHTVASLFHSKLTWKACIAVDACLFLLFVHSIPEGLGLAKATIECSGVVVVNTLYFNGKTSYNLFSMDQSGLFTNLSLI